jgi:hypothetical protein
MKLPALRLDKDAFAEFLIRHGEKIVGGVVAVGAALLVWGGIDSLRSRSVRTTELPTVIRAEVDRAESHIASVPRPPEDLLPPRPSLADGVAPWLAAKPQAAPAITVLDKPLFPEFSRRSQPEVLPIEDLRAIAGVAVFSVQAAAAAPDRQPAPRAGPERRGKPGREREPAFPEPGVESESGGFPNAGEGVPGSGATAPGRIAPYVIVSGLIPVAKQQEEYRRRFASAGYRDARRDSPLWSDFTIERCSVVNGTDGPWRAIELAGAVEIQARDWPATQPLSLPPEYLLLAAEERRSRETPLEFAGLLPLRIDQPWAAEPIHPWVLQHIRNRLTQTEADTGGQPGEPPPQPDAESAVFGEPGSPEALREERMPPPPGDSGAANAAESLPEYRMFSFVDTTVKPDARYRYRVGLKVWNPNINLPQQHLVDPGLAKEQRLASPVSDASPSVLVPHPTRLLVDVVSAAEVKKLRLKPGVLEVLVLAAGETGNYVLRSALIDVGGLANVDKRLNRTGDLRARGEDAITDRLLVDVLGQQVESDDKLGLAPRPSPAIPEPFAAVFLRPDGSFEQVTAADSERLIDRYRATLPERDSGRRDGRPGTPNPESDFIPGAPAASDSPFSFPR